MGIGAIPSQNILTPNCFLGAMLHTLWRTPHALQIKLQQSVDIKLTKASSVNNTSFQSSVIPSKNRDRYNLRNAVISGAWADLFHVSSTLWSVVSQLELQFHIPLIEVIPILNTSDLFLAITSAADFALSLSFTIVTIFCLVRGFYCAISLLRNCLFIRLIVI